MTNHTTLFLTIHGGYVDVEELQGKIQNIMGRGFLVRLSNEDFEEVE